MAKGHPFQRFSGRAEPGGSLRWPGPNYQFTIFSLHSQYSADSIKDPRGSDRWNSRSHENDLFGRRAQAVHRLASRKLGAVECIGELGPYMY